MLKFGEPKDLGEVNEKELVNCNQAITKEITNYNDSMSNKKLIVFNGRTGRSIPIVVNNSHTIPELKISDRAFKVCLSSHFKGNHERPPAYFGIPTKIIVAKTKKTNFQQFQHLREHDYLSSCNSGSLCNYVRNNIIIPEKNINSEKTNAQLSEPNLNKKVNFSLKSTTEAVQCVIEKEAYAFTDSKKNTVKIPKPQHNISWKLIKVQNMTDNCVQTNNKKGKSVGTNTDDSLLVDYINQKVLERLPQNNPSLEDVEETTELTPLAPIANIDNFLDNSNIDHPIIGENANFGVGPVMDRVCWNNPHFIQMTNLPYQSNADSWKIQFFLDLKHCNQYDSLGNTPLHMAVLQNDVNLVKRQCMALKVRKLNVNAINSMNLTALQLAIVHDVDIEVIRTLFINNADCNVLDKNGNTLLHLAVLYSSDLLLQVILTACGNMQLNTANFEGDTALILCVLNQKQLKAEILLSAGADVNITDKKSGRTSLFHAVEANDVEMVRLLMNYKAQPKIGNFLGTSPHDAMHDLDDIEPTIRELVLNRHTLLRMTLNRKRKFNKISKQLDEKVS